MTDSMNDPADSPEAWAAAAAWAHERGFVTNPDAARGAPPTIQHWCSLERTGVRVRSVCSCGRWTGRWTVDVGRAVDAGLAHIETRKVTP